MNIAARAHSIGAAISAALLLFAWHANAHGSYSIVWWLVAMLAMSIAVVWVSWRDNGELKISFAAIIGWAIVMRSIGFFTPAFFEDDYFRFLWDGYRTLVDGNPYRAAPAAWFGAIGVAPAMQDVLSRVNYPQVPTIYGPALQHLFTLGAAMDTGALWPWKLIVCVADIGAVLLLVKNFGSRAVIYAWSPLVIHEIAVAAHPDGLIGGLILLAFFAAQRQSLWWMAIFVGTAVAMKVHAVIALPFLLVALQKSRRVMAAVAAAGVYALHWLPYIDGFSNAWRAFATFARDWQFNALGFSLFSALPSPTARAASLAVIATLIAVIWRWQMRQTETPLATALVIAFGVLLFFSPVVNPWYLLWLLPLACATRYATPWAAACVLPFSYASDFNLDLASAADGHLPVWVGAVQWAVIAGAMIRDLRFSAGSNQPGCQKASAH